MIWIYLIAFILTVGGYVGWYCEYRCVKKKDVIIKRHIDIGDAFEDIYGFNIFEDGIGADLQFKVSTDTLSKLAWLMRKTASEYDNGSDTFLRLNEFAAEIELRLEYPVTLTCDEVLVYHQRSKDLVRDVELQFFRFYFRFESQYAII